MRAWGPVLGFKNRKPTPARSSNRSNLLPPRPPRVRTFSPLIRLVPWLAAPAAASTWARSLSSFQSLVMISCGSSSESSSSMERAESMKVRMLSLRSSS